MAITVLKNRPIRRLCMRAINLPPLPKTLGGDIGLAMQAYARAAIEQYQADTNAQSSLQDNGLCRAAITQSSTPSSLELGERLALARQPVAPPENGMPDAVVISAYDLGHNIRIE